MNIYLDESGNFIGNGSKYFIVGSFAVTDVRRVAKAFRKWQKKKFPKKLKSQTEIKFNNASLNVPKGINLQTEMIDSASQPCIQIADWICGALARHHENKQNGEKFYTILKGSIFRNKELFEDYWRKLWE